MLIVRSAVCKTAPAASAGISELAERTPRTKTAPAGLLLPNQSFCVIYKYLF